MLPFHLVLTSELLGLKEHCQIVFTGVDSNIHRSWKVPLAP